MVVTDWSNGIIGIEEFHTPYPLEDIVNRDVPYLCYNVGVAMLIKGIGKEFT